MPLFGGSNTADAKIRVNYDGKAAERGLKGLKNTIKTVVTAAVIRQVAKYGEELARLGAQAETVEKNFVKMAEQQGRSADTMMSKLRGATKGMISDIELQQNAMKAMISGVNFDDMVTAFEYVSNYAAATGADITQKLQTVMTGFARGSAQFMDDVGIQVMGAEDVVSASIEQMKEKMDQFATSEEDASVQAANLDAELANLKAEVGRELIPVFLGFVDIMQKQVLPLMRDWLHLLGLTDNAKFAKAQEKIAHETKIQAKWQKELTEAKEAEVTAVGKILGFNEEARARRIAEAEAQIARSKERQAEAQKDIDAATSKYLPKQQATSTGSDGQTLSEEEKKRRRKAYDKAIEEEMERHREVAAMENERNLEDAKASYEKRQEIEEFKQRMLERARKNEIQKEQEAESELEAIRDRRIQSEKLRADAIIEQRERAAQQAVALTMTMVQGTLDAMVYGNESFGEALVSGVNSMIAAARAQIAASIVAGTAKDVMTKGYAGLATAASKGAALLALSGAQFAIARAQESKIKQAQLGSMYGDGLTMVGEEGPEIVSLPKGSRVTPAPQSREIINNNTNNREIVHNYYGLSTEQVIQVQRNTERRNVTGTLL